MGRLAEPPSSFTIGGKPIGGRFQIVDGKVFTYESKSEAEAWASACNADHNGWKYSVLEVDL